MSLDQEKLPGEIAAVTVFTLKKQSEPSYERHLQLKILIRLLLNPVLIELFASYLKNYYE